MPTQDARGPAGPDLVHLAYLEAMAAAVYACDADGRITFFNSAAAELWGRRPELGRDRWSGAWRLYRPDGTPVPPEDSPMAVALRERRRIRGIEIVVERPDGTRRRVLPHPDPLLDDLGRVTGSVNTLVDITGVRRAEEASALLSAIVANSDDAIISKTLNGVITSWNAGAERIFGYTPGEAVGRSIMILIPDDRREEEEMILARIRAGERVDHFETVRRARDGRLLDMSLTVSPVRDAAGRIVGASKIARDITERRRAEEALRQTQERYRAIVEGQTEMVCRFRPDGTILFVNGAYARALGARPEAVAGTNFWSLIRGEDRADVRAMLERLRPGNPEIRIENRFETSLGTRWTLWTNRALSFDDKGRPTEVQSSGIDITDRRLAEEAMRESALALERANHELERFVGIASHDLKEPLRGMATLAAFVLEDEPELSPESRGRLERVRQLAGRLTAMINGLLEYARSGGERLSEPVALEGAARSALDKLEDLLRAENAEVEVRGPLPVIEGDPILLERMFANLIVNAVKHNRSDRKRVEIGCEGGGGGEGGEGGSRGGTVYVRDNGPGIDPRHHGRIFGLFKRVPSQFEEEGVGLGLALVQNIVRSHGGRVSVRSELGEGATFLLQFPRVLGEARAPRDGPRDFAGAPGV